MNFTINFHPGLVKLSDTKEIGGPLLHSDKTDRYKGPAEPALLKSKSHVILVNARVKNHSNRF